MSVVRLRLCVNASNTGVNFLTSWERSWGVIMKFHLRQRSHDKVFFFFCMEFHGAKVTSKSWKFVWKCRVITRRQFPSEKNPSAAFLFPRYELPLGPYEFPLTVIVVFCGRKICPFPQFTANFITFHEKS